MRRRGRRQGRREGRGQEGLRRQVQGRHPDGRARQGGQDHHRPQDRSAGRRLPGRDRQGAERFRHRGREAR
ncbi:hypothetical protein G5V59_12295 [Nocardioides sp. W3-2-3]|uniref:hypothetical protein n=1 Tax=Nocardioides convexus TaxID=2712224 RepID=UPI0024188F7B|nr:hypothetical protein [Nocardioides convexus]NHA00541.1 hypothetical protein [Nocardioides convexus]